MIIFIGRSSRVELHATAFNFKELNSAVLSF